MFTSYFANVKNLPADLRPVSIARSTFRSGFKGASELRLAPTREMLKMPIEQYNVLFEQILLGLDAAELYASLGDSAVLLCWERPGQCCHRRRVAEWFEEHLGIVVPEFGFSREATPPYCEMAVKV